MEEAILLFIQEYIRNDFLTPIAVFMTRLGDNGVIWIVIAGLFLIFKKTRRIGVMIFIALVLSAVINNVLLKNIFMRVRPYDAIEELTRMIGIQSDYSFPSGHAATSFAVATIIYKTMDKRYGILALILAFLISLSRLYLGVHYPTDILAGFFIGNLIGTLVVYLYGND